MLREEEGASTDASKEEYGAQRRHHPQPNNKAKAFI
jgi:hypothetical protein